MALVEWALTPMGHCNPKEEYANVIAFTNHLEILCFVTELPLARLLKPTKAVLTFWGGGGGCVESAMTWALNGVESALGTYPSLGFKVVRPEFQASRVDGKGLQVSYSLDRRQCSQQGGFQREYSEGRGLQWFKWGPL